MKEGVVRKVFKLRFNNIINTKTTITTTNTNIIIVIFNNIIKKILF